MTRSGSRALYHAHLAAFAVSAPLVKRVKLQRLPPPDIQVVEQLANSMGLFLQKTNIIRDYLEV